MVVVVASSFEVERSEQRECQRLEKMFGEFSAEIATLSRLNLALNLIQGLPDKSKAHFGAAFIHREHKAEASDAAFVTKGLF